MYLHLLNSDFQTVMDFYSNTTNHTVMTTAEIRIYSGPQVAFLPTFILPLCPHCFDIGLGLLTSTQGQTLHSSFNILVSHYISSNNLGTQFMEEENI